jgi:hypothetical protein
MKNDLKRMTIATVAIAIVTALTALPALAEEWKYDAA